MMSCAIPVEYFLEEEFEVANTVLVALRIRVVVLVLINLVLATFIMQDAMCFVRLQARLQVQIFR